MGEDAIGHLLSLDLRVLFDPVGDRDRVFHHGRVIGLGGADHLGELSQRDGVCVVAKEGQWMMLPSTNDVFYTVEELSRRWKCHRRYVYKLIEARCLLATRIGPRMYRVRVEDLTSYEDRNRLTT